MNELSGIILAAGLSSRMGYFKPLMKVNGKAMIRWVIDMMRQCGASPIVVVTGHRHQELESALAEEEDVEFAFNPDYARTQQLESLRIALKVLQGRTQRVMISPADVPMVDAGTAERLRQTDGDFVRPLWNGECGHPVFLKAEWFDYLLDYNGPGGLRGAMERSGCNLVEIDVEDRGTVLDNDTPDDIKTLTEWVDSKRNLFTSSVCKFPEMLRRRCDAHLDKVTSSMLSVFSAPLRGMTFALEAKDEYSYCHSNRVADLAMNFVSYLNLSPIDRHLLHLTAQVHDIGKIGIPDAVLLKPDRLTDEEYAIMKRHTVIGADIISKSAQSDEEDKTPVNVPDLFKLSVAKMEDGTRHHHERWDGRGYPDGLQADDIPEYSRIIALCDSTDAMLSNRVYRRALTEEKARQEIIQNSGKMYDPEMAEIYVKHWDDIVKPVYRDQQ